MFNYNYKESMKANVREWINEHKDMIDGLDRSDAYEVVEEACWVADEVTGNASGSFTFSRFDARCYIFGDVDSDDYISEMVDDGFMSAEEVGQCVASSNWEKLDVCIRCWLLSEAVSVVLDEMYDD